MGYRNYLFIADKKKLNKIRKMNRDELYSFINEAPFIDDDDDYCPYWRDILKKADGEEALELGKYIDFTERLKPFLKPLFHDKKVHTYYNEDTELMLAMPELLQELTTIFKEKIQAYYKDLLNEKSSDEFNTKTQLKRLLGNVKDHLTWSIYLDKLPKNKYSLCDSWLYEHEIFNILYLMKIFNPKKQALIYCGA